MKLSRMEKRESPLVHQTLDIPQSSLDQKIDFSTQLNVLKIKGSILMIEIGKLDQTETEIIIKNLENVYSELSVESFKPTPNHLYELRSLQQKLDSLGKANQKAKDPNVALVLKACKELTLNKSIKFALKKNRITHEKARVKVKFNGGQFWSLIDVCKVRHSHSTISPTLSDGKTSLMVLIDKLMSTKRGGGWNRSSPPLQVYKMPDGKYTSWDNRRLWALKKAQERYELAQTPDKDRSLKGKPILVQVWTSKHSSKSSDVENIAVSLEKEMREESKRGINPSKNVVGFRKALLDEKSRLFKNQNSRIRRIFMRIYIDAGKPKVGDLTATIPKFQDHYMVVVGYTNSIIRWDSMGYELGSGELHWHYWDAAENGASLDQVRRNNPIFHAIKKAFENSPD